MKQVTFVSALFFALVAIAADENTPTNIYHDGWNDLNKNGSKDVYEDPSQPMDARVEDLLGRMTLDEKLGQLQQSHREVDAEKKFGDQLRRGEIASFLDGTELIEKPTQRNRLQHIAVEQSRLGIPLIFGHDSIHGFRTIFPIPLGTACAWEPELFERIQTISARETATVGIDWSFAPMVDLARDPRWGRIAEGFGEDPWLGCLYAAACVRGFQGTNPAAPDRLLACMKHYVGYGAAEGGRDYNTTEISEYTLRNFYLPQFKAGVNAGAWTVMSAFNNIGMPASGNHHTLTEILRDEWKFRGYVISDWTSVGELIPHGVAADDPEAARLAINAGVDMEMVSTTYHDTLKAQVTNGAVTMTTIDEAVRRVLRGKIAKGLFERPYVDESLYTNAYLKPDAVALAREAAQKCCVLLKNENGVLPLSKQKKIALIGPFADDGGSFLGCWAARGRAEDCVSLAKGIRAKLPQGAELTVTRGCDATSATQTTHNLDGTLVAVKTAPDGANDADIEKAVAATKSADVAVLALGEPASWSGENSARSTLGITGRQLELFERIVETGKPVVVVLINGRPLTIERLQEKASAILETWNAGVQGGNGIADILFGDADPSGRLTVSFPRSVGQVPLYYNHYNTGRPTMGEYVDGPRTPLYPFGFGLTYAKFDYGQTRLSANEVKRGETIKAQALLKNSGSRAGTEVVQLYIHDVAASAGPRSVRELKGFQKVHLEPGASKEIEFTITDKELGYYDTSGRWLVEPGKFEVWIARDSGITETPLEFELK